MYRAMNINRQTTRQVTGTTQATHYTEMSASTVDVVIRHNTLAQHLDWLLQLRFIRFHPEQVLRGIHVIVHPKKHRQVASSTLVSNDGRRRRWQANIGFGGAGFAGWACGCWEYARVVGGVRGWGWASRGGRRGWGCERRRAIGRRIR
jgi:hypothetical protein